MQSTHPESTQSCDPHLHGNHHDAKAREGFDLVFIGNFVKDVIVTTGRDGQAVPEVHKMGGSVTYGPLAAATYGVQPRVICYAGNDIPTEFFEQLEKQHGIDLSGVEKLQGGDTSYLLAYDKVGHRTLTLKGKGFAISQELVSRHIGRPDAICFVPVAGEFDEDLVIGTARELQEKGTKTPIIAIDIQGYLRAFDGELVTTKDRPEMIKKLKKLSGWVSFLKAEYAEAQAILGEDLTPSKCASTLQKQFNIPMVAVTLGKNGSFICTQSADPVYVPTYKPVRVMDETGCGDTFLACTVCELLNHQCSGNQQNHTHQWGEEVFNAVKVGSAAASFLVECMGPEGFATREAILERIATGQVQGKETSRKSVTFYPPHVQSPTDNN